MARLRSIPTGRLTFALAAVAAVAIALPAGALADTPQAHSGKVGPHYLTDGDEYAGARCHYDGSDVVDAVRVRPPVIYARNVDTHGQDAQVVGWQIIVRARPVGGGSPWHTIHTTGIKQAVAHDDRPASFSMRTVSVDHQDARVIVRMLWYDGSSVSGWAKHRVDHYTYGLVGPGGIDYCPGEIV